MKLITDLAVVFECRKSPELMRQLKDMISCEKNQFESISHKAMGHRKVHHPDVAMEIGW